MTCEVLASVADQSVAKRLLACLLAALRANGKLTEAIKLLGKYSLPSIFCTIRFFAGSFGVYVATEAKDRSAFEFYSKLGFLEITGQPAGAEKSSKITYLGRSF